MWRSPCSNAGSAVSSPAVCCIDGVLCCAHLQIAWLRSSRLLCPITFLKFQDPISLLIWLSCWFIKQCFRIIPAEYKGRRLLTLENTLFFFISVSPAYLMYLQPLHLLKVKLSFVCEPLLSTCEWVLKHFSLFMYHRKYFFFLNSWFTSQSCGENYIRKATLKRIAVPLWKAFCG